MMIKSLGKAKSMKCYTMPSQSLGNKAGSWRLTTKTAFPPYSHTFPHPSLLPYLTAHRSSRDSTWKPKYTTCLITSPCNMDRCQSGSEELPESNSVQDSHGESNQDASWTWCDKHINILMQNESLDMTVEYSRSVLTSLNSFTVLK